MEREHVTLGIVFERHARASLEQALVRAPTHAHGQPHALPAFFVRHGRCRVQVLHQIVRVTCSCQRILRIPIMRDAEGDGGLVDGLPALLEIALVVDANAPDAVRPAVMAARRADSGWHHGSRGFHR